MRPDSVVETLTGRLHRHRLVMASTGKAFECYQPQIAGVCQHLTTVREFLESEPPSEGSLFIADLETVCNEGPLGGALLGPLRAKIDETLLAGVPVLLASRFPKVRFPDVPGSSLLDDARVVHLPLETMLPGEPLSCFPSWSKALDAESWLRELLDELGLELLARLDEVLFESPVPPNEALNQLPPNELESLYFVGLIRPHHDSYHWANPQLVPIVKAALEETLAESVSTLPELPRIFDLMWQVERCIRAAYRASAINTWGPNWKESCLTNDAIKKTVLSRASDVSYRGVKKLGALRDPLEWLTLSELLDIREQKAGVIGTLGLEASLWKRFAQEVLPIRNQVSHMRLTRHGDAAIVNSWLHLMRRSLRPTPKAVV